MADLLRGLSLLCVVAAVLCAALALLRTRDPGLALGVLLDLLLAGGLLRLSAADDVSALVLAAALVLVRRIAASGFRTARAARAGGPAA